jgi:hypothetical protein
VYVLLGCFLYCLHRLCNNLGKMGWPKFWAIKKKTRLITLYLHMTWHGLMITT